MRLFDYLVTDDLVEQIRIGSVVNIPWKVAFIKGVVFEFADTSDFPKAKEIKSLDARINLRPEQLQLLDWFSRYYYYSLSSSLKLFLPELPKKAGILRKKIVAPPFLQLPRTQNLDKLKQEILTAQNKGFLLLPHNYFSKLQLYLELCEETVKQGKQILILFPQVYKVEDFYQYLPKNLRDKTAVLTADAYLSKNRYFEAWKKINDGMCEIIIGTRSAVFAPFQTLETIVVDDSHSEDYKQWDQNPRYEVVNVCAKLAELFACRLILSSLSPRVEDGFLAKQKNYKLITIGQSFDRINLINLNEERQKLHRFTYLSDALAESLENCVQAGKKAILLVNKKGLYSYLLCDDCGKEFLCPHCNLPLVLDSHSQLVCHNCKYAEAVSLNCPSCGGPNLKKLGIGANQVENQLKKVYREKVIYLEEIKETPDNAIIVTANMNLPEKIWQNIGLLAFVYVDSLVYLADFNSNYKLFSFISENFSRMNVSYEAQVLVQTCFPENPAFKSLKFGYSGFYKQEIESREIFQYPPFGTIIKIFFDHHDRRVGQRESELLYSQLKDKLNISEPYLYYRSKVRSRYRYQMMIKLDKSISLKEENKLLALIPEFWTIDKNPVNLL